MGTVTTLRTYQDVLLHGVNPQYSAYLPFQVLDDPQLSQTEVMRRFTDEDPWAMVHQQMVVPCLDGTTTLLDAEMAEFIPKLWAWGISTRFSCQGSDGGDDVYRKGYIAFVSDEGLREFLEGVAAHVRPAVSVEPENFVVRFSHRILPELIGTWSLV